MTYSLTDRLLHREVFDPYRVRSRPQRKQGLNGVASKLGSYSTVRGLYGDKKWVDDLDIVNELGGHTGCVNALSWSKSGRLLASGSDDTHLNIHTYQPDNSTKPFVLNTTIATGHTANIFSVKFMPHSNDSTLVSCAGDGQVRVFDIEYSGHSSSQAHMGPSSIRHHSGVNLESLYQGANYLSPATTNARVYSSHTDRVKRIVTESSPHLFLTCSEDGEVRQWDLRLPSSAYPAHRRGQQAPPPLISYKRFRIDLNTITCSGSQPHYIVLGGTHLHAFLHDRRMLGRDLDAERGSPSHQRPTSASGQDDELMGKATKCVRRFAPNGKAKMMRRDSGHITACKISDANPNEMVGSWSADHIYSFNLVSSPDATDAEQEISKAKSELADTKKSKLSTEKKRKREPMNAEQNSTPPTMDRAHASNASRLNPEEVLGGDVALRVRYGNGQSEDIPLESQETLGQVQESIMTESQKRCLRIAKSVSKIRKLIFSPHLVNIESSSASTSGLDRATLAKVRSTLNATMSRTVSILPEMEEISSSWGYPMHPSRTMVAEQKAMRSDRALSCQFLQACGTVARLLGGNIQTVDPFEAESALEKFKSIRLLDNIGSPWQIFCYTFLGSVVAWLSGGQPELVSYFRSNERLKTQLVIGEGDGDDEIQARIIAHLLQLADMCEGRRPIVNYRANRFENDETRVLFAQGRDAVLAFARFLASAPEIPERESNVGPGSSNDTSGDSTNKSTLDDPLRTTSQFWKDQMSRGLLLSAGEGITFSHVNHAFGGPRIIAEPSSDRSQEDIDPDEPDEVIDQISMVANTGTAPSASTSQQNRSLPSHEEIIGADDLHAMLRDRGITVAMSESDSEGLEYSVGGSDEDSENIEDTMTDDDENIDDTNDDNDDDDDNDEIDEEDDEDEDEDEDDDEDDEEMDPRTLFATAGSYGRGKERVESDVPCSSHTRVYSGHCNVKTVKDVNFYGLDDEYVVSGSDSGHVFIWDRKTSKLLNVLQGDGEVVNVIQGHPYEPMLAVSGIDHTIKIFNPDQRAQHRARHGLDLGTSSNGSRPHMRRRVRRGNLDPRQAGSESRSASGQHTPRGAEGGQTPMSDAAAAMMAWDEDEDDLDNQRPTQGGLASCKRMKDSYSIMSQNDADRQGGMEYAVLTRSFLAQLAAHIYARRANEGNAAGGGGGGGGGAPPVVPEEDGEGEERGNTVVPGDDCSVM